ncbi:MAG: peptidoglycan editing factor PgeF [Pseudomonadota bacterium]|nr:peptidoglycan editing factor PgeF [Pseudomonadota bacterium]
MTGWIEPDWPAPTTVRAVFTTRQGGVSKGPYASMNLGDHVGDDPGAVARNRYRLGESLGLPTRPVWLSQVHGTHVIDADAVSGKPGEGDAALAGASDTVCAVMSADCLPVLFCDRGGKRVAAAHAGWRGLSAGVLETTVAAMSVSPDDVLAWMGPAIGPDAFEVGEDVVRAFVEDDAGCETAFTRQGSRWMADIYALARRRLRRLGVRAVHGGGWCTFSEPERFFSYRRDGITGRMAALIWLRAAPGQGAIGVAPLPDA